MKALGRIARTSVALAAVSALVVGAGGLAAWADDVYNNLDASVDVAVESVDLTVGATSSASFYLQVANGDGDTACNLDNANESVSFNVVS